MYLFVCLPLGFYAAPSLFYYFCLWGFKHFFCQTTVVELTLRMFRNWDKNIHINIIFLFIIYFIYLIFFSVNINTPRWCTEKYNKLNETWKRNSTLFKNKSRGAQADRPFPNTLGSSYTCIFDQDQLNFSSFFDPWQIREIHTHEPRQKEGRLYITWPQRDSGRLCHSPF